MADSDEVAESVPQADGSDPEESADPFFTGITGLLVYKHPWTLPFLSFVGCSFFAVVMLLTNPAGNSTSGDANGPSAPVQPWVVAVAGLLVVGALLSLVLLVLVVVTIRRRSPRTSRIAPGDGGTRSNSG